MWELYDAKKVVEVADEVLRGDFVSEDVEKVIKIGLLCTQAAPTARPKMSEALSMLTGNSSEWRVEISRPGYLSDLKNFAMNPPNPLVSILTSSTDTTTTCSTASASTGNNNNSYAKLSISFADPR